MSENIEKSSKNWTTSLLLCIFTGCIGGHLFYTGRTGRAILYILTIGGILGILPFIDFIKILTGSFVDSEAKLVSK